MSLAKKIDFEQYANDPKKESALTPDKLAGYYYKIGNHEELLKIGKGLLIEVGKGVKNFAFTSVGYKNSQQKTILGLSCFFDQNTSYKIAIVSDNLSTGAFADLVDSSTLNSYSVGSENHSVVFKSFHHHFDFYDYAELMKLYANNQNSKNFELEIKKLSENYDVILWDIPEMEEMKKNSHFHYRISHFYESMTVIVGQNVSSGKQLDFIKNYYSNYNIQLNGVLFDTTGLKEQPKRRKFLGIF